MSDFTRFQRLLVGVAIAVLIIISLLVVLVIFGGPRWKVVSNDTPWIAPNKQLIEEQRPHFKWNEGFSKELRWTGLESREYDLDSVAVVCEQFFRSSISNSPLPNDSSNTLGSWKTIVSLSPTIVLVVPADLEKAKMGWLLGTNHPVREFGSSWESGRYDCGTTLFYNPGLRWFSPDLKQPPELVRFGSNGSAQILIPDGKLELQIQEKICTVRRN